MRAVSGPGGRWVRRVGVLLAAALLAGCGLGGGGTGQPQPAPASPAGPTEIAAQGTVKQGEHREVSGESGQEIRLTAPELPGTGFSGVRLLLSAGLLVSAPVHVETGEIPEAGLRIRRTFPAALPEGVRPLMVVFDEGLQTWVPVETDVSPDRRAATAIARRPGWWTDVLIGSGGDLGRTQEAFQGAGAELQDAGSGIDTTYYMGRAIQRALAQGKDAVFFWSDRAFDQRVEAPTCRGEVPEWARGLRLPEDRPDSLYRWCVGSGPQTAPQAQDGGGAPAQPADIPVELTDILAIRVRVNDGAPALARVPAQRHDLQVQGAPVTYTTGAVMAVSRARPELARELEWSANGGVMVPGGGELTLLVTRDQIGERRDQPLIALERPSGPQLVTSVLGYAGQTGRPVQPGQETAQAEAVAAATTIAAMCAREVADLKEAARHPDRITRCVAERLTPEGQQDLLKLLAESGYSSSSSPSLSGFVPNIVLVGPTVVYAADHGREAGDSGRFPR